MGTSADDAGAPARQGRALCLPEPSFVLGELTGAHPAWPGAGLIDPSRIAMAGHSAGGAAAIAAMLTDSRIRAGIDMDGSTAAPIPDEGLSRPFLFWASNPITPREAAAPWRSARGTGNSSEAP